MGVLITLLSEILVSMTWILSIISILQKLISQLVDLGLRSLNAGFEARHLFEIYLDSIEPF